MQDDFGMIHVVKPGDTLYLLGKKYGVTVSAIMYANPYADVYNLQAGDEILIPRIGEKRARGKEILEDAGEEEN